MRPRFLVYALGLSALALARPARGAPEWNAGVVAGVAGTSSGDALWDGTAFHGAVRGDVLWGRRRWSSLGFGPSAEIGTVAFGDARFHLGATALLPIGSLLSVLVTPAAYARTADSATFGASGRVLVGFRSLNHYGSYAMTGGLVLGIDQDLSAGTERAVVIGAQIDGALLALPILFLVQSIRGTPE